MSARTTLTDLSSAPIMTVLSLSLTVVWYFFTFVLSFAPIAAIAYALCALFAPASPPKPRDRACRRYLSKPTKDAFQTAFVLLVCAHCMLQGLLLMLVQAGALPMGWTMCVFASVMGILAASLGVAVGGLALRACALLLRSGGGSGYFSVPTETAGGTVADGKAQE
ncbi:hypothetical protein MBLNU459_g6021t3 [Dothideomycetes sp. NU459]